MKKLFIILLILFSLRSFSQYSVRNITNGDTLWTKDSHPDSMYKSSGGVWTFYYKSPTVYYLPFSRILGKPTTLAGYGITNGASTTDLSGYSTTSHTHTFSSLTSKPTTLSGYGITDAFDGVYSSLTGKPSLFDGTWSSLTGKPTTTSFLSNSTDKNFVSDAKLTVVNNTSGTNTGDNSVNNNYSGLVTNATHTGDATGATALTVVKINGVSLAGLGTGILKNTTGTGVPSIAVAGDFPTLNQNTSGTAAGLSAVLSYANGGISASAATSATTGTMTVSMTTSVVTITPTGACTFNASGGVAGQILVFSITTSGTSAFVLTWGTNFRKTGTLSTGTTSARFFTVTFICLDGTTWTEIARTAVQS